jgi:hypothetical protein
LVSGFTAAIAITVVGGKLTETEITPAGPKKLDATVPLRTETYGILTDARASANPVELALSQQIGKKALPSFLPSSEFRFSCHKGGDPVVRNSA